MDHGRRVLRQDRLQRYIRILGNRYNVRLFLRDMKGYGVTDNDSRIIIKEDVDNENDFKNFIFQKALSLHELGHILYTKSSTWNGSGINKHLINIIEDGRVEERLSRRFPKNRLYFIYLNQHILKFDPEGKLKHVPLKQANKRVKFKITCDLMLREAKKTTGIPQAPKTVISVIKNELNSDYDTIMKLVRHAVDTEKQNDLKSAVLQINTLLNQHFPAPNYSDVAKTSTKSITNSGSVSLSQRNMTKRDESLVDKLEDQLNNDANQIDDDYEEEDYEDDDEEEEELDEDDELTLEPQIDVQPEPEDDDDKLFPNSPQINNDKIDDEIDDEPELDDEADDVHESSDIPEESNEDLPEQSENNQSQEDIEDDDEDLVDEEDDEEIPEGKIPETSNNDDEKVSLDPEEGEDYDDIDAHGGSGSETENWQTNDDPLDEDKSELRDIIDEIEDSLEEESLNEHQVESDILKTRAVDREFPSYNNLDEGDFANEDRSISTNLLEAPANKISHLFRTIAQVGDGWNHNKTRGKLEMHKIHQVVSPKATPRVFKKRTDDIEIDLSVSILIDGSSSMGQNQALKATQSAYVIARSLEICNYNSEIVHFYGFSGSFHGVKSFNQSLTYTKDHLVPVSSGATPLLPVLNSAADSLEEQKCLQKLMIIITDGAPDKPTAVKQRIQQLENNGYIIVGILIDTIDTNNIFNDKWKISIQSIDKLPLKMTEIIKEILIAMKRS